MFSGVNSRKQMRNKAIIYSGGMDSTCLLYEYQDQIKLAITFDYGSKHNDREYLHALIHTQKLGIEHIRIDMRTAFSHFKSNLLQTGGEIPNGHYEDESMKKTVVPFRNGIMLAIVAGIAESRSINEILIANHFGDHAIYPDCRTEFIKHMNAAIFAGTEGVKILAPYSNITKRDIALIGRTFGVDFSQTYSCYNGLLHHCGECGTCNERKEALQGFDPTIYIR